MTRPNNMSESEYFESIHSQSYEYEDEDDDVVIEIEDIKDRLSKILNLKPSDSYAFWKTNAKSVKYGVNYKNAISTTFDYESENIISVDLKAYSKEDIVALDKETKNILFSWFKDTFKDLFKQKEKQAIETREEEAYFHIDYQPEQWEKNLFEKIDNKLYRSPHGSAD